MPDLVHDIALIRQRRNPARIAHRTYEIVQGEDVQLAVTVWNRDTDAQPVDVSGTMLFMSLFRQHGCGGGGDWGGYGGGWCRDYGWVYPAGRFAVAQVAGVLTGELGRVDINLTRDVTSGLGGRYWFLLYAVNTPVVSGGDFSGADFSAADFLVDGAPAVASTTVLGQGILDVVGCPWGLLLPLPPATLPPPAAAALPSDFLSSDFSGSDFLATLEGTGGALLVAPTNALLGGDGVPLLGADYTFLLPP